MPNNNQTASLETDAVMNEIASLFAHGIVRLAKSKDTLINDESSLSEVPFDF